MLESLPSEFNTYIYILYILFFSKIIIIIVLKFIHEIYSYLFIIIVFYFNYIYIYICIHTHTHIIKGRWYIMIYNIYHKYTKGMHVHGRIHLRLWDSLDDTFLPDTEPFPVPLSSLFQLRYQISPLLCIVLLAVIISMAPGQRCQGPSAVWPPRTAAWPVKMQVYHTRTPSVTHTGHVAVYKTLSGKFTVAMFSATGLCSSFRKT